MIGLDGEKMSKSKGNLVFVSKLVASGRDPMAIRWALMKSHYRTDRMWTEELLLQAEREVEALRTALAKTEVAKTEQLIQSIVDLLADDLNTPGVIETLNQWVKRSGLGGHDGDLVALSEALDSLLGLKF
jgi:L-cysteine:1D-myo-inositol 2-amino-2-deoxy-alpha-D-glucopyranoside ligase